MKGTNRMGMNCPLAIGLFGSVLAAVCCFTPILTGILGMLGLGVVTGYLDFVLFLALAAFLATALYGLVKRNSQDRIEGEVGEK